MKNCYFLFLSLIICNGYNSNYLEITFADSTIPTLSNISVCDDNIDGFAGLI